MMGLTEKEVSNMLNNDEQCVDLFMALEQHQMDGLLKDTHSRQLQDVLIKFTKCKEECHKKAKENENLKNKIKNMQINNANNNMFHQAFLSAYNHIADMDLPHNIKEEILEAFNKREIE